MDRKTVTGLVHSVETTYEPHRNLITSVTNQAIAPNFNLNLIPNLNLQPGTRNQEPGMVLSSYIYTSDREAVVKF